ncbi:hypothetical protein SARC_06638 [Sphaeroforma arctica JP610]|uniref:C2H2-type domain-containing protein n=1 Tax=Sphaeroforma arctica JP610 TaxID=667725 RepID=A0A0L0FWK8_9EUKA|nr:hypothetical protein SARC_06638 [Sphaeroforma arctica JP610]KNC81024.1 hypothetical protein SARC_06638 [Sphaeroforma arctica JP610]|eukprot:XP_014154926.1 hypothetical protein SARC_06638 [Sphaeroforma arctica JP610]
MTARRLEASEEVRAYVSKIEKQNEDLKERVAQLEKQFKAAQDSFNVLDDDLCCAKVYHKVLEAENRHFIDQLNVHTPGFRKAVDKRREIVADELINAWHRREKRLRKNSTSDLVAQLQHRKNYECLRNSLIEIELQGNLVLDIETVKEVCKRADYIKEFVRVEKVITDARHKCGGVDYLIIPRKANKPSHTTDDSTNTGSHKRAHIDFDGEEERSNVADDRKRLALGDGTGKGMNTTETLGNSAASNSSEQKAPDSAGTMSVSEVQNTTNLDVDSVKDAVSGGVPSESQNANDGVISGKNKVSAGKAATTSTTGDSAKSAGRGTVVKESSKAKEKNSANGKGEGSASKGLSTDVHTSVVLTWFAEIAAPSERFQDMLDDQDFRCGDLIVKRGRKRMATDGTADAGVTSLPTVPERDVSPPPILVPERERAPIPVQQYRPSPNMNYSPSQHRPQGVQQMPVQAQYMHPSADPYAAHAQYQISLSSQQPQQLQQGNPYSQEYGPSANERYAQAQAQHQKHVFDDEMRMEDAETLHVNLHNSDKKTDRGGKRSMREQQCPDCDTKFKYMKPFENHMRLKHGKDNYNIYQ